MRNEKHSGKKRQISNLGRVQMRIMQVLWSRDEATARDITDELNRSGQSLLAHSTVQTLLRQLEAKGMVVHETRDRTFVFRASQAHETVATNATRDLLARLFDSSALNLVAHLLRHEAIPRDEMNQLRQLIADKEAETRAVSRNADEAPPEAAHQKKDAP